MPTENAAITKAAGKNTNWNGELTDSNNTESITRKTFAILVHLSEGNRYD